MTECDTDSPTEHVLPLEDAVSPPLYIVFTVIGFFAF